MNYTVNSRGNHQFEVRDEADKITGYMDYSPWRPGKVKLTTADGMAYHLAATGFWRSTISITKTELPFGEITPRAFKRDITVSFNNGRSFIFKQKSIWNSYRFILLNEHSNEIASVHAFFHWRSFSFNYEISILHPPDDLETRSLLPLILLYCSRLIRMRRAAMAGV